MPNENYNEQYDPTLPRIKQVKVKQDTGEYGNSIPVGVDAENIQLQNKKDLEKNVTFINKDNLSFIGKDPQPLYPQDVIDDINVAQGNTTKPLSADAGYRIFSSIPSQNQVDKIENDFANRPNIDFEEANADKKEFLQNKPFEAKTVTITNPVIQKEDVASRKEKVLPYSFNMVIPPEGTPVEELTYQVDMYQSVPGGEGQPATEKKTTFTQQATSYGLLREKYLAPGEENLPVYYKMPAYAIVVKEEVPVPPADPQPATVAEPAAGTDPATPTDPTPTPEPQYVDKLYFVMVQEDPALLQKDADLLEIWTPQTRVFAPEMADNVLRFEIKMEAQQNTLVLKEKYNQLYPQNWEQTDVTKPDYIRNKPFKKVEKSTLETYSVKGFYEKGEALNTSSPTPQQMADVYNEIVRPESKCVLGKLYEEGKTFSTTITDPKTGTAVEYKNCVIKDFSAALSQDIPGMTFYVASDGNITLDNMVGSSFSGGHPGDRNLPEGVHFIYYEGGPANTYFQVIEQPIPIKEGNFAYLVDEFVPEDYNGLCSMTFGRTEASLVFSSNYGEAIQSDASINDTSDYRYIKNRYAYKTPSEELLTLSTDSFMTGAASDIWTPEEVSQLLAVTVPNTQAVISWQGQTWTLPYSEATIDLGGWGSITAVGYGISQKELEVLIAGGASELSLLKPDSKDPPIMMFTAPGSGDFTVYSRKSKGVPSPLTIRIEKSKKKTLDDDLRPCIADLWDANENGIYNIKNNKFGYSVPRPIENYFEFVAETELSLTEDTWAPLGEPSHPPTEIGVQFPTVYYVSVTAEGSSDAVYTGFFNECEKGEYSIHHPGSGSWWDPGWTEWVVTYDYYGESGRYFYDSKEGGKISFNSNFIQKLKDQGVVFPLTITVAEVNREAAYPIMVKASAQEDPYGEYVIDNSIVTPLFLENRLAPLDGIRIGEGATAKKGGIAIGTGANVDAEGAIQINEGTNTTPYSINYFDTPLITLSEQSQALKISNEISHEMPITPTRWDEMDFNSLYGNYNISEASPKEFILYEKDIKSEPDPAGQVTITKEPVKVTLFPQSFVIKIKETKGFKIYNINLNGDMKIWDCKDGTETELASHTEKIQYMSKHIVTSPNGTQYEIVVDDTGKLTTAKI